MTIKQTIEKAIERGWKDLKNEKATIIQADRSFVHYRIPPKVGFRSSHFWLHTSQVVLDFSFWKALGESMGWNTYAVCVNHGLDNCPKINCFNGYSGEWLYRQHNFIDHLAEGGDIKSYFKEL